MRKIRRNRDGSDDAVRSSAPAVHANPSGCPMTPQEFGRHSEQWMANKEGLKAMSDDIKEVKQAIRSIQATLDKGPAFLVGVKLGGIAAIGALAAIIIAIFSVATGKLNILDLF